MPACTAPWESFTLGANGEVRLCCHYQKVMGSTLKASFEDVWNGQTYIDMREPVHRPLRGPERALPRGPRASCRIRRSAASIASGASKRRRWSRSRRTSGPRRGGGTSTICVMPGHDAGRTGDGALRRAVRRHRRHGPRTATARSTCAATCTWHSRLAARPASSSAGSSPTWSSRRRRAAGLGAGRRSPTPAVPGRRGHRRLAGRGRRRPALVRAADDRAPGARVAGPRPARDDGRPHRRGRGNPGRPAHGEPADRPPRSGGHRRSIDPHRRLGARLAPERTRHHHRRLR